MSEPSENASGELVKGTVEIVKTVYGDAIQPAAYEIGKALGTIGKTVNLALSPIRGFVWGWEQIEDFVKDRVERVLAARAVPAERIVSPDPDVAVPALEAMRYSKLRERYVELIATAMDRQTASIAHPAFVEILKQMTQDEILILTALPTLGRYEPVMNIGYVQAGKGQFTTARHLSLIAMDSQCAFPDLLPQYVDNLCRLGITEVPAMKRLMEDHRYNRIRESYAYIGECKHTPKDASFSEELLMLGLTPLGATFREACSGATATA
jgi:hypothetical protein